MTDQPGNRVGDYEVLGVLGTGGMGSVFKVRNVITDRVEAMKTLLPNLAGRQDLADRFLREIKVLAALNHPNIAALRTAFTWENKLVMIMEYVEGVTIAGRAEHGPIPAAEAVNYIDQALAGLGYAHAQHVVHRDIKPSNMMLTPEGVVKIMDFGIARSASDRTLTATGTTLGSLYYMSPEQIKGEGVDGRSDLYAVGVSLYEMITGKRPFEGDSDFSLMAAHLQKNPVPPIMIRTDLPAGLSEIMMRAMAKDAALRFQTAEDFRSALKKFRGDSVPAPSSWQDVSPQTTQPMDALSTATLPAHGTPAPPPRSATAATASTETPSWLPAPAAVPASATSAQNAASATQSQSFASSPQQAPIQTPTVVPAPISAASAPAPAPIAAGPFTPAPAGAKNRGLYISLGAVIVLVALVGAGLYGPLRNRIHAGGGSGQPPVQAISAPVESGSPSSAPNQPSSAPFQPSSASSQPAAASGTSLGKPSDNTNLNSSGNSSAASPVSAPPVPHHGSSAAGAARAPRTHGNRQTLQEASTGPEVPSGAPSGTNATAPSVDTAQLEELDHQMDQLASRADAVNASLATLRQSQASQGLNLRGDISAAQQRMQRYLNKAQGALQNQDAANAKKYLEQAETETANLERFLGR